MSVHLIEKIQTNLQYPALLKIDPNTQEAATDDPQPDVQRFGQAAIPAVLTALYKYGTSDEGAEQVLGGDNSTNWVSLIFQDTENETVEKVAAYAYHSIDDTRRRMQEIAGEAVKIIGENIQPGGSMMDVKNYLSAQRNSILLYLPAALQMGALLNDDTLDDNTNKMEGPISSLIKKIGSAFSNPENEEKLHTKE